jgi:heme/copper-type cytochrome/quinol oxidase subunit 4
MNAFEMTMVGFAITLFLAALAFWIAMIRHCWLNTPPDSRERWVWLLIIVLGKLPGAFAYFLLRKKPALG